MLLAFAGRACQTCCSCVAQRSPAWCESYALEALCKALQTELKERTSVHVCFILDLRKKAAEYLEQVGVFKASMRSMQFGCCRWSFSQRRVRERERQMKR